MYKIVIVAAWLIVILGGCSNQPKPETTIKKYMAAWEKHQYNEMYDLLSDESKDSISKEAFTGRYTSIYEGINVSNLKVTYDSTNDKENYEKGDTPSYSYHVSMDTLAGPLEFSHEAFLSFMDGEDNQIWTINWGPSMIFPSMEKGDTVYAKILSPERGEIVDVNGEGLAINGTVQEVGVVPEWIEQADQMKEKLSEILNISVNFINKRLDQSWVNPDSYVPLVSIGRDDQAKIDAIKQLSGPKFVKKSAREYPQGAAAAHLTGYVGAITAEELEERKSEWYQSADHIGKTGLEAILEDSLRGEKGGEIIVKDSKGNTKKSLLSLDPKDGDDYQLTIDIAIQKSLYKQLKDEEGSAAALDPLTGEVKALVSSPSYDPNEFILGISSESYQALMNDPNRPLLNRFTNTYAPGSTFKPITAAIGIKTGAVNPSEERSIPSLSWSKKGWGDYAVTRVEEANVDKSVNLRDALVRSDNIYFARSILDIGEVTFLEKANKFGFTEDLPFMYPVTASQITGKNGFKNEIQLADTGYGQGQVEMSTLHLGVSYTPFITKGDLLNPSLVKDGTKKTKKRSWHEDVISEETADMIANDLYEVVNHPDGTGYEPQVNGITIAGKTGTAELKQSKDEEGKENGWFVAWDAVDPELLISMMIEDVAEEGGSHYVVPKVKSVLEKILKD